MDWLNAVCILCIATMHHGMQAKTCAWSVLGLFDDVDVGRGVVLFLCCIAAHDASAIAGQLHHQFYDAHHHHFLQNQRKQVEQTINNITIST